MNSFPKNLRFPELSFQLIIFIEILDKLNGSKTNKEIMNTFNIFNGINKNNPSTALKIISSILEDDNIAPKNYLEFFMRRISQYYYYYYYYYYYLFTLFFIYLYSQKLIT